LAVAAGLWCLGARPAHAEAVAPAQPAIVLAPAAGSQLDGNQRGYAVSVQPGGGVWQSVVVESRDDTRRTVTLAGTGAAGTWAHPSNTTIVLGPHQRAPVPFTIAPPVGTPPGRAAGALTATVDGGGATASIGFVVTVTTATGAAPTKDATGAPATRGAPAPETSTPTVEGSSSRSHTSSSDLVTMFAVVGALARLVLAMIIPPLVQRARQRRADRQVGKRGWRVARIRVEERFRSTRLRRHTERVADAAAAVGAAATVAPPELSRADVRRAEQQRRVAERRERLRAERERLRQEAQRAAADAWDERVQAMRERAEAEARGRADAIEAARRRRAERAAELDAQRLLAEERRLEQLRAAEARRREETAERARQRAAELAARRRLGREAGDALRRDVIAEDLQRQREIEQSRAAVVQLRSEEARELARSWIVDAQRRHDGEAPPPLPGEGEALEHLLVDLPAPGAAPPPVDIEEASPVDEVPTSAAARRARTREKVAVVALDIEALNARLREQSST
jgi:hypothetical protein